MALAVTLDKEAIRRRFDRAAAAYDIFSVVQRGMARRLAEGIEREPGSILDLGCGTGFLTALLAKRFPQARLVAVDFAPAMIELARKRVPSARFLARDIEELEPEPAGYDLIVSNATIQWLTEPERTLARLVESLSPKGELQLATFGPRTFWELDHVLAELGCERGLSLPPVQKWETLLAGAGISRIRAHSCEERFSYPDCAAFLRSVKSSGAGYTPHVLAPGTLAEGMRRYDERFSNGAGVTVTYEIVTLSGRL
ncbi:MAG: methyltransferase domain-containing protein [Gaiellaceae bacterium]